MYRAHWRHLLSIAFVVYILIAALTLLLVAVLGWFGAVIAGFISVAGVFWLQGALVVAIEDVRDGRPDLSIRETLERMRARINTLSLAALLVVVALFFAAVLVLLGLLVLVFPGLVLLALFIWGFVRWILMVPLIMLEGRGVFASLDRSAELVRGHWWSVFAVVLVTILILIGVGIGVSALLYPLPNWLGDFVGQIVSATLTAPFAALAWTITYYELRGLKEVAPAPAI
jgi:glycerophosphoryl diester phosphodiesterase family protein